jgi:hypothetical protein
MVLAGMIIPRLYYASRLESSVRWAADYAVLSILNYQILIVNFNKVYLLFSTTVPLKYSMSVN